MHFALQKVSKLSSIFMTDKLTQEEREFFKTDFPTFDFTLFWGTSTEKTINIHSLSFVLLSPETN